MKTHKERWDAIMALLDVAEHLAKECGSEQEALDAGDVSAEEYGGYEWGDFETKLATIYVHLGGDLGDLAHAVTQPWAQELQDRIKAE